MKKSVRYSAKRVKAIQPEKYAEVYELMKSGLSDKDVAERFGLKKSQFRKQVEENEALKALCTAGREVANASFTKGGSFQSYLYGHLEPRAKKHWDAIMEVWKSPFGKERNERLAEVLKGTANASKNVRQGLFVHAWIKTGFNGTKASEISGVPYRTYMSWVKHDPHFQHLLEEIDWHRKNFFESAFVRLVKAGNPAAVIHAAKSQLADRGYGTKVQFEGSMHHVKEDKVTIEDLDVPLETKKQLLRAIERKEQKEMKALKAHDPDVQDAEIISVKEPRKRRGAKNLK